MKLSCDHFMRDSKKTGKGFQVGCKANEEVKRVKEKEKEIEKRKEKKRKRH